MHAALVLTFDADVSVAAVGYLIFRGSNSQKNAFRQNPEYAEKKRMCYVGESIRLDTFSFSTTSEVMTLWQDRKVYIIIIVIIIL